MSQDIFTRDNLLRVENPNILVKDVAEELDTSKDMVVQKLQKLNQDLKEKDKEIKHLIERVHTAEGKELLPKQRR